MIQKTESFVNGITVAYLAGMTILAVIGIVMFR